MIQWFPGHMAKARRLISDNLKIVDVVLELADARIPISSRNPLLKELLGEKPRILILTKEDLADPEMTKCWRTRLAQEELKVLPGNFIISGRELKQALFNHMRKQAQAMLDRRARKGIINKTIRTMVVGIPNVGKSTLINFLVGKGAAGTGDRPGVTRGKQWIRLDNDIELLDMPGILWPKFDDQEVGYRLAATGAIKDEVFNQQDVAAWLLNWLLTHAPGSIAERYKVEEMTDIPALLDSISLKRGFIKPGGYPEPEKTSVMLLDEFRGGKIGRFTLDRPENL